MDQKGTNAASEKAGDATACGRYAALPCSVAKVKRVWIGELPPEIGPVGTRLIVLLENKRWMSVLLGHPMDNIGLAKCLRELADGITQNATPHARSTPEQTTLTNEQGELR